MKVHHFNRKTAAASKGKIETLASYVHLLESKCALQGDYNHSIGTLK